MQNNRRREDRGRARGQSLVELALVIPVLLLLLMVAIDFGRVYLGWVNLQNMSRLAANYAANHADDFQLADVATLQAYQDLIQKDATANSCRLRDSSGTDDQADPPVFSGYDVGDTASVALTCRFGIISPIISNVLGNTLAVSASSQFPVKTGFISGSNSGGGGSGTTVTASFTCTPTSGAVPLTVQCNDESGGGPTTWTWTVSGPGGSTQTSGIQDPIFTLPDAGSYSVTLVADNALGQPDTMIRGNYITVAVASTVDFDTDPGQTSGTAPLTVNFHDLSSNNPTSWAWDFDNNGTVDSTQQNPSHTYSSPGTYAVKLTVTNAAGTAFLLRDPYIFVSVPNCTVPLLIGQRFNSAQGIWAARGFTTTVGKLSGAPNGNFVIGVQSISNGQVAPCNSIIQVGP